MYVCRSDVCEMTTVYEGDDSSVVSSSRFTNSTRPLDLFVDLTRTLLTVGPATIFKFGFCMTAWQRKGDAQTLVRYDADITIRQELLRVTYLMASCNRLKLDILYDYCVEGCQ